MTGSNSNNGGSVAGRTGVALWNSGILLTRLLDTLTLSENKSNNFIFKDKTVLELGCGTALASVAASALGAKYVIATDGNTEVLGLARRNLELNGIYPLGSESDSSRGTGEVATLQWGLMDASDFYDRADVIIGSDLTYNSGNWRVLVETLNAVLAPNGIVIYVTLGHAGFTAEGEMNGFIAVVESEGELEVVKEGTQSWPFQRTGSLNRLLGDALSSNEKEVINGTGGFSIAIMRRRKKKKFA